MKRYSKERGGFALLVILLLTLMLLAVVTLVALNVTRANRGTNFAMRQITLDEGVKSGIDMAVARLWTDFFESTDPDTRNMMAYRNYIDGILPNNPNGDPVPLPGVAFPFEVPNSGVVIENVAVQRTDDPTGTTIDVRTIANVGGTRRAGEQSIRIAGELFDGFAFAILANNINCILCHARVSNLDLEWNNDPSNHAYGDMDENGVQDYIDNYGTFDRVRVAALQSMLVRPGGANSEVAGTMYTRGLIYNDNGTEMADLSSTTLTGFDFTSGNAVEELNGKLLQDGSGNMVPAPLTLAGYDGDGNLNQYEHLYKDYPTDEALQTDGVVPNSFPAPFPDDGGEGGSVFDAGNRMVDASEFAEVMNTANGSLSGGVIHGLPQGQVYSPAPGEGLPTTDNFLPPYSYTDSEGNSIQMTGAYDGNMILVGTPENPIVINGKVAINGDLVIKGTVVGSGQLLVKGNSYVVGDVVYGDNAAQGPDGRPYGTYINNGNEVENALALTSGGSILMGDYLTIRGKNDSGNNSKYPNKDYSIRFREANKTATVNGETLQYGYFDPGSVDPGEYQDTMFLPDGTEVPRDGHQVSFTTSELMLFNQLELQKALEAKLAGEDYTARFYGLREGQPDNIFIYDYGDEHTVRYDEGGEGARVKLIGDYTGSSPEEAALIQQILAESTTHYMNPQGNWMSESVLRQIWWNDEMARPDGTPFRFDGLLYSNNAIFAVAHSKGRHGSHKDGRMFMRGAIIAADLGILAPQGFDLWYDERVKRFLQIEDTNEVEFLRLFFRYAAVQEDEVI